MFAVVAGALLALVLVVFAGVHFWKRAQRYTIVFDEHGVRPRERCRRSPQRHPRRQASTTSASRRRTCGNVRVAIEVEDGTPIRTDTSAILRCAGITGLKVDRPARRHSRRPRLAAGAHDPASGETHARQARRTQAEDMVDQSAELMDRANQIAATCRRDRRQTSRVRAQIIATRRPRREPHRRRRADARRDARARTARRSAATLADPGGGEARPRCSTTRSRARIERERRRRPAATSELVDGNKSSARRRWSTSGKRAAASRSWRARSAQKPSRLLFSKPEPDRKLP